MLPDRDLRLALNFGKREMGADKGLRVSLWASAREKCFLHVMGFSSWSGAIVTITSSKVVVSRRTITSLLWRADHRYLGINSWLRAENGLHASIFTSVAAQTEEYWRLPPLYSAKMDAYFNQVQTFTNHCLQSRRQIKSVWMRLL